MQTKHRQIFSLAKFPFREIFVYLNFLYFCLNIYNRKFRHFYLILVYFFSKTKNFRQKCFSLSFCCTILQDLLSTSFVYAIFRTARKSTIQTKNSNSILNQFILKNRQKIIKYTFIFKVRDSKYFKIFQKFCTLFFS